MTLKGFILEGLKGSMFTFSNIGCNYLQSMRLECLTVIGTELKPEIREKITRDLLGFLQEECEVELSLFRGEMVVEFVAEKISSEVYNNAILDARAFLSERLEDMEATLYAKQS